MGVQQTLFSTAAIGVTAVGTALVGGVFFAFSGFVMPALGRLPAAQATAAMQAVNRTAVQPPLMIALFGTAALCVVVPVLAARSGQPLVVVGGALYVVGTVGVTIVANVPLNDRLDAGSVAWADYLVRWTRWNTVRTVAALGSSAVLVAALVHRR